MGYYHNKGVFVERDGVLLSPVENRTAISEDDILPGVAEGLKRFRELGFKVFMVTHQPMVAHGVLSDSKVEDLHCNLVYLISQIDENAVLDGLYHCPHDPKGTEADYSEKCECRKPKPGLLAQASSDFSVDLDKSILVGSDLSDIVAGHLAGCKSVLITGDRNSNPVQETDVEYSQELTSPEGTFPDLVEVAKWLEGQS